MNADHAGSCIPHINVCVCTYKRPLLLRRLLKELSAQDSGGFFTFSIVVVDNDSSGSARPVADDFAASSPVRVTYCLEPQQNIALARNRAIASAPGDLVAFIDDDEFPAAGWLRNLFAVRRAYNVAGVLGPVKPYFEHEPPDWVRKGRFFDRPTHPTGYRIGVREARTGNVLFVRNIVDGMSDPFRQEFGTGGEDTDFFRRMMGQGHVFLWCDEAVAYELVPPERCTRRYLLHKALWRGGTFLKHPEGRAQNLLTSCVAVPLYVLVLPVISLTGHHQFMKYLVKLCDHASRILLFFGIRLVRDREPNVRGAA